MRATQARSSSSERALARQSIGRRCWTFSSRETGSPPTRCVGESGVTSSGWSRLDRAQLVEQRVVGVVADLGVVEDVVAVVVVRQLLLELVDFRWHPRGRPRARPGPARDHRARDRRRVGLRLAARRAVGGLPHHQRGRAAERADLQPRPLGPAPAVLPEEHSALRGPRVREGAAAPRRDQRRQAHDRPDTPAALTLAEHSSPTIAELARVTNRPRTTSTPRR